MWASGRQRALYALKGLAVSTASLMDATAFSTAETEHGITVRGAHIARQFQNTFTFCSVLSF